MKKQKYLILIWGLNSQPGMTPNLFVLVFEKSGVGKFQRDNSFLLYQVRRSRPKMCFLRGCYF